MRLTINPRQQIDQVRLEDGKIVKRGQVITVKADLGEQMLKRSVHNLPLWVVAKYSPKEVKEAVKSDKKASPAASEAAPTTGQEE